MKILFVGDQHHKDNQGYADYVKDRRVQERDDVLDQIYDISKDHDVVVLMGDNLNSKNNTSETISRFTKFVIRFLDSGKYVFILAGNHEKRADGKSAVDYLKHIGNDHLFVASDKVESVSLGGTLDRLKFVLCPFFARVELGAGTDQEASDSIESKLENGDIFISHNMISGLDLNGVATELMSEPVLDVSVLKDKFKYIVYGHIHKHNEGDGILGTGSLYTNEVNEVEKFIWTLDIDEHKNINVIKHLINQRGIYKFIDPREEDLKDVPEFSIVKLEITDRDTDIQGLKEKYKNRFDGLVVVEKYENERRSSEREVDLVDYSIEKMLKLYSEEKNIDVRLLLDGYELIK